MSYWLFLCVSWPFYIYLLCFFICSISFCSSYSFISLLTFIHVFWHFIFLPLRALAILIIVILYSWSDHSNISVTTESNSDAFLFLFFFFFASNCVFFPCSSTCHFLLKVKHDVSGERNWCKVTFSVRFICPGVQLYLSSAVGVAVGVKG